MLSQFQEDVVIGWELQEGSKCAFIFNMKSGTKLGYREVLLTASGLLVLALAATLSNLDIDMNPDTKDFAAIIELVPLGLLIVPENVIFFYGSLYFLQHFFVTSSFVL